MGVVNLPSDPQEHGQPDEFAAALRAAIAARGLTLDRLRVRLKDRGHPVSTATLSYWQSGRSRPERPTSLQALSVLEEVLRLPRGQLLELLPAHRIAPGQAVDAALTDVVDEARAGTAIDEMAAELGLTWGQGLERLSVHEALRVRADRTEGSRTIRETLRATVDGVDRFAIGYATGEPVTRTIVSVDANGRLGRQAARPDLGAGVAEVILPRALSVGESVLVEHSIEHLGTRRPSSELETAFVRAVRDLHLTIHFAEGVLPLAARWFTAVDGQESGGPLVVTGRTMQRHWHDFGPGLAGVAWSWGRAAAGR